MTSIVNYPYCKESLTKIREWTYGTNWPSVYIIYNSTTAYRDCFTKICLGG